MQMLKLESLSNMLILFIFFSPPAARAWGGKGHDWICQAATEVVTNEKLHAFLKGRAPLLSYLCNAPDTAWRDLSDELIFLGNPSHYLNPEKVNSDPRTWGRDYQQFIKSNSVTLTHRDLGSLWWRVDQFHRQALELRSKLRSPPPQLPKELQDKTLPFNEAVFELLLQMGLIGHFIADASMPLHNDGDYDGEKVGHAGLHAYFENTMVDELTASDYLAMVQASQRLLKSKKSSFLQAEIPFSIVRELSLTARDKIPQLIRADLLKEKGNPIKKPLRLEIAKTKKLFRPLLISQLSAATAALAHTWTRIYVDLGEPDLRPYRSWRFPHQPVFVPPDYLHIQ